MLAPRVHCESWSAEAWTARCRAYNGPEAAAAAIGLRPLQMQRIGARGGRLVPVIERWVEAIKSGVAALARAAQPWDWAGAAPKIERPSSMEDRDQQETRPTRPRSEDPTTGMAAAPQPAPQPASPEPPTRWSGSDPETSGPAQLPVFYPGQWIAERYRVVRFIAQGGMGEVYEVEDHELKGRIALKTVRPEIVDQPGALERFKREIQMARRISHPNICRVFDLGRHRVDGGGREIVFLTMELLAGETLAARIRRRGRLNVEEALPIAQQICAALSAAHHEGVVHRDFKSGNILLVEDPAGRRPLRAVITDFGLARPVATPEGGSQSGVGRGAVFGSPLYMAPEQVRGGPLTTAADLYALGVVLYEMVTGTWPFVGPNEMATAVRRLVEPPKSPRLHAPDLDPAWESAILRCLEIEPAARFESAAELARALSPTPAGPQPFPARAPAQRGARRRLALALTVLSVVVLIGTWALRRSAAPTSPSAAPEARRAVAVLGFRNLRAIPGEAVARGRYLSGGVDGGGRLRLDLRLQDAAAGEIVAAFALDGATGALFDLVWCN